MPTKIIKINKPVKIDAEDINIDTKTGRERLKKRISGAKVVQLFSKKISSITAILKRKGISVDKDAKEKFNIDDLNPKTKIGKKQLKTRISELLKRGVTTVRLISNSLRRLINFLKRKNISVDTASDLTQIPVTEEIHKALKERLETLERILPSISSFTFNGNKIDKLVIEEPSALKKFLDIVEGHIEPEKSGLSPDIINRAKEYAKEYKEKQLEQVRSSSQAHVTKPPIQPKPIIKQKPKISEQSDEVQKAKTHLLEKRARLAFAEQLSQKTISQALKEIQPKTEETQVAPRISIPRAKLDSEKHVTEQAQATEETQVAPRISIPRAKLKPPVSPKPVTKKQEEKQGKPETTPKAETLIQEAKARKEAFFTKQAEQAKRQINQSPKTSQNNPRTRNG
jgi:hypothetical protein